MKNICICLLFSMACFLSSAQTDTTKIVSTDSLQVPEDTVLRIINLNPVFSVHVDSVLSYQFEINKPASNYFWYMKNAPLGVKINKDNGSIYFKADKSYFLSGRLKYDYNYKVTLGVQNLTNSKERIDSVFTIVFFNTDIIPSQLKPTVSGTVWIDEGDTLRFKVLCETGNFPIESILTQTSIPIGDFKSVQVCNDDFVWAPTYDFVKETDTGKVKSVVVTFIGTTKFKMVDTAQLKIIVKNGLNYPLALEQYNMLVHDINSYILKLKFTFLQLDKSIKRTKGTRTGFDLTAASAALSGTVLSTSKDEQAKRTGLILPSVGVILSPIKEATAPTKTAEQNQATLLRSSIKRLEYVLQDNALVGEKDVYLAQKTAKLKEELKQSQMQLIDVPIEITNNMTQEELNNYFNSRKVMKKYSLKK
ncbi:MAG TPA: hypothetical protein VLJ41_09925 [Segetibacter sp.]|nr:hypothetical protein [Segetibacter sp.]